MGTTSAEAPITTNVKVRSSKSDFCVASIIVVLCCAAAYARWLKMDTLVWGDPARWLFEAYRAAIGDIPYRDFTWNYSPFSLFLFGWAMRLFGPTFATAQVVVDVNSVVIVLLTYMMVRRILPRALQLATMVFFIAVCTTSLMWFNLFSFLTYVPSLQTGAAGLLLLLLVVLDYFRTGRMVWTTWVAAGAGAFVAATSKLESLVGAYSTLAVLALLDRWYWFARSGFRAWIRFYSVWLVVCTLPALAVYGITGAVAGFANMKAGLGGYGMAGQFCPWWPTGLGTFGALASLGEAAFLAACLSLTRRRQFLATFGSKYYAGLAAAIVGGFTWIAYVLHNNWKLLTGHRPLAEKLWYSAPSTLGTSAVLLPFMWSSIVLWVYLGWRLLLSPKRHSSRATAETMILLTAAVAMSARGWFNWNLSIRTDVPALCYPFFLFLAPYLAWRFVSRTRVGERVEPGIRPWPTVTIVCLLIGYGMLRIAVGYPTLISNRPYQTLQTAAGPVRLVDYSANREIYDFVVENTSADDTVLDIPYGGGINVAAHRPSPVFTTLFVQTSPPERVLSLDSELIRKHPPKVVIARNEPRYGAEYGINGCLCAFPRLVWIPPTSSVIDKKMPILDYIQQNYRVAKIVGQEVLLVPR